MSQAKRSRVRDKWREKSWVVVEAPPFFNKMPVAYIPITDRDQAVGRVVETTLYDLLKQDPQQINQKLFFQVTGIDGDIAKTVLKAQEYSREYLRSLIRRGSSMVNLIRDYTTKDGFIVRVYLVALIQGRINSSRKHTIRLLADKAIKDKTSVMSYAQFSQEVVLGKAASDIYSKVKTIIQPRHVGIRKTKLIKAGEAAPEEPLEAVEAAEEEREELVEAEGAEAEEEAPAAA